VVIIKAKMYVKKLKNLQEELSSCEAVDGRNPNSHQSARHSFPALAKVLPRDLSPLKPLLVEALWDRVRSRLVPLEVASLRLIYLLILFKNFRRKFNGKSLLLVW